MKMKIVQFFILVSSFIYTMARNFKLEQYDDSEEIIMRRYYFGQNYTQRVTGGKIKFEYTEDKGVFCKTNEDIFNKEFTFKITKEFVTCSFDMYPFKLELKEPIHQYMINKYGKYHNETKVRTSMYLFAYGLMFARYENKAEVNDYVRNVGKDYYVTEHSKELIDYIESLPTALYTIHSYREEDRKFFGVIGFVIEKGDEVREIHEHLVAYIKRHMLPEVRVGIF